MNLSVWPADSVNPENVKPPVTRCYEGLLGEFYSGYGGSQGNAKSSAECPLVYYQKTSRYYYLRRNQLYGQRAKFPVYRSKGPLDFGMDNDLYLVETMPYAAPEIVDFDGQTYLAILL